MKSKVNYNVLGKFFDYEKDELEFIEFEKFIPEKNCV